MFLYSTVSTLKPEHQKYLVGEVSRILVFRIRGIFDSWILDPGWVKNQDQDQGWKSRNYISESLKTIFRVKMLKFFDADPESGIFFGPGSGMKKIGFVINIPVSQQSSIPWFSRWVYLFDFLNQEKAVLVYRIYLGNFQLLSTFVLQQGCRFGLFMTAFGSQI